jgi:lysophospholipase L1-like esterase
MAGARVELQGSNLVVVFSNGSRRGTGISVADGDTVAQITSKVRQAIQVGIAYAPSDDEADRVGRISASTTAAGIHRRMHPAPRETEAPTPTPSRPPRRGSRRPPRETAPARPPAERPPPRPTITMEWIQMQLRDSARAERTATGAISTLHRNSRYIDHFFVPDVTRDRSRTDLQRQATVAVFNMLYEIPAFRLYLSSQATLRPEFQALQDHLTSRGEQAGMAADASSELVRAADFYIRHYLFNFVARPNGGNERYRREILQTPNTRWRVERSDEVRATDPDPEREGVRFHYRRMYISGPMDADTLTSAALYLRRWHQEHPARGRGRPQERIALWSAPAIIEIPSEQRVSEPAAAPTAVASAEPPNIEEIMRNPNVVLVGASLTAGGAIQRELTRLIRPHASGARLVTEATSGDSIQTIRGKVDRGHLFRGHNIVVISANAIVNTGPPVARALAHMDHMISEARRQGALVIVHGGIPWATYPTWSTDMQRTCDEFYAALRQRTDIVYVDIGFLGEGSPPSLRRQFDSGDHLHPNTRGRNDIARRIYEAAFQSHYEQVARQPAEPQRNALEEHAHRQWRTLQTELEGAMRTGRPQAIVTIIRGIPQEARQFITAGSSTDNILDRALRTLNRHDLDRAFDTFFNTILHDATTPLGREFTAWCRASSDYQGVARASVRLSEQSTAADRRLVTRAVQSYLNYVAGRAEGAEQRYGQDLEIMMRQVFGASGNRLDVNGRCDPQTITAISLFSWRMSNRSRPVGHWARGITGVQVQPAAPPAQPTTPQPEQGERRRVLQGI